MPIWPSELRSARSSFTTEKDPKPPFEMFCAPDYVQLSEECTLIWLQGRWLQPSRRACSTSRSVRPVIDICWGASNQRQLGVLGMHRVTTRLSPLLCLWSEAAICPAGGGSNVPILL